MDEVGTLIILKGKTVRGRNRIRRGGHSWMIKRVMGNLLLMDSISNPKEKFWMLSQNDPHMIR